VPEISEPIKFKELPEMTGSTRIVLSEMEQKLMLKDAVPLQSQSVLLAFGPEGGWKEQELASLREHGWLSASLGSTVLRAETAVIAAVAVATSILTGSD